MTDFTGQVNPAKQIHTAPPPVRSVKPLTAGQIGAFGTIVVDLILAQVAFALGGVNILGMKPFAFLTDWGNSLVQQASDAYKNSFVIVDVVEKNPVGTTTGGTLNAVYSAAAAVNSTATTASQNADTANGNISTTWNALWDGAKGTTGSENKTAADVKAAVLEVRNTGIDADGKAQDTIDGLYSAVMDGDYTGMPADYVKPALTGLTYTARNNVATGSNLVVDAGGEYAAYWTQTGVTLNSNSTYVKSGSHSLQFTRGGSARTLFFNTIDTGAVQPYFVRQSEIYYVECYLKSATSFGTVELIAQVNGSTIHQIATATVAGTWIKLSGQYSIPAGVNIASFGIRVGSGSGSVYVDDMLVREITNAQNAQTDVESTWNQIYNGVYNLSLQGRSLTDVFNAMYFTKQTADGGVGAAGTAQETAETATGIAQTADDYGTLASASNNLVIDPDFTDMSIRRSSNGFSTEYVTTPTRMPYSLKITALLSTPTPRYAMGPTKLDGNPVRFPVVPGMVFFYDIWIQAKSTNSGSGDLAMYFLLYDVNGTGYGSGGSPLSSVPVQKGTWQHLTGSYTIPEFITGSIVPQTVVPAVSATSIATGDVFYLDRVFVYR